MSFDPCPICHRFTEKLNQPCQACCQSMASTAEITNRIVAAGERNNPARPAHVHPSIYLGEPTNEKPRL